VDTAYASCRFNFLTIRPYSYYPPEGSIFIGAKGTPMTGEGFEQAFEEVRKRAGIDLDVDPKKRLTPHCLSLSVRCLKRLRRRILNTSRSFLRPKRTQR
jgi:hypothetical protein